MVENRADIRATDTGAGVQLPCPRCGELRANVTLHLADSSFECAECNESFDADQVREFIRAWTPVLAWVASMPRGAS